ncbi:MAG: DUF6448 family protein [candidate division WOR-3 bacterium]
MKRIEWFMVILLTSIVGMAIWLRPLSTSAHCDTMQGPVVQTAKVALEKGDVTPVLKWVKKEHELEIQEAFKKVLSVRGLGKDAKELADAYFFETLVRIHRAGEGAPYTGLKSEAPEPIIQAADGALETGSPEHLVKHITESVARGIREKFARVKEAKRHANESVENGREYVAAYVDFTHYIEHIYHYSEIKSEPIVHHPEHRQ